VRQLDGRPHLFEALAILRRQHPGVPDRVLAGTMAAHLLELELALRDLRDAIDAVPRPLRRLARWITRLR
jgi:hypothetical protein